MKQNILNYTTTYEYPSVLKTKLVGFVQQLNRKSWAWTEHFFDNEENPEKIKRFLNGYSFSDTEAFEFTTNTNTNEVVKVGFRIIYDRYKDLCVVVSVDKKAITFWFNDASDEHITLDKSKYNNFSEN